MPGFHSMWVPPVRALVLQTVESRQRERHSSRWLGDGGGCWLWDSTPSQRLCSSCLDSNTSFRWSPNELLHNLPNAHLLTDPIRFALPLLYSAYHFFSPVRYVFTVTVWITWCVTATQQPDPWGDLRNEIYAEQTVNSPINSSCAYMCMCVNSQQL